MVGVVADEKISALNDDTSAVVYASYEQSPVYFTNLVVRAAIAPTSLEQSVRGALYELDKTQAVLNVRTLEQIKSTSVVSNRFQTVLLSIFSVVALVLAAIGMYGVLAYSVSRRTHEMAVRATLGASTSRLLRSVLGRGLFVTFVGLVVGAAGAILLMPFLGSLLYNVDPRDPYLMGTVTAILLLVALLAYLIPSRRATRVDSVTVLRSE